MIEITGHTQLYGLLGSPVAHSISPMMHNESFKILNMDSVYLCFDVDTTNLSACVNGLKLSGIKGFNCTMPNKNLMCELADELSPAAKLVGAVNTVANVNGKLIGHMTDGIGYMRAAFDAGFNIIGKNMTLLGAGGAATAICAQAALDGVKKINVFSIKDKFFDRAQNLVDNINSTTSCKASLYDLEDTTMLNNSIKNSDILTNATSVGMAPNTDNCIIKDFSILRPELIVSDIIYNPKQTLLISKAKEIGAPTFNGLYMLLYQGAEAFKIWTGKEMPVQEIKAKYFS
jgi:quinate/shikimate dehydrogenase